jgi:hypothetical protein
LGSVLDFPASDPNDAVVGARIRRWRDRRGVPFEDLAAALDLTPEAVSKPGVSGWIRHGWTPQPAPCACRFGRLCPTPRPIEARMA